MLCIYLKNEGDESISYICTYCSSDDTTVCEMQVHQFQTKMRPLLYYNMCFYRVCFDEHVILSHLVFGAAGIGDLHQGLIY